ncbi:MAG: PDZ domain-containing protein, partial [Pyrinomonadaceae bacterium]
GDNFEVLDVVPDSPAEKSGIKLGDKILAVNGKRSDLLNLPEVRLILKSSEAKEPVKLTLKSGQNQREVLVILKDLV